MRNPSLSLAAVIIVLWATGVSAAPPNQQSAANQPAQAAARPPATRPGGDAPAALPIAIRWWGQACVSIETFWGLKVVIDPFVPNERLAYPKADLSADLVLVTHEHFDHAGVEAVKGKPTVLRGLTGNGDWATWNEYLDRPPNQAEPKVFSATDARAVPPHAVRVQSVRSFHDSESGAKRGKNTMFVVEADGVRILHCGDLGQVLTDEQLKAIGPIDVLLIPVGGTFTIDADAAMEVVKQVKPRRLVWPIHYKTDAVKNLPLAGVETFVEKAKAAGMAIRKVKGNTVAVARAPGGGETSPDTPPVIVCDFKPVQLPEGITQALSAMRADRQALIDSLGKVSRRQLDHKPADGTHTIRWNFEHTAGAELGFFSQLYHALDPQFPVISERPAQSPAQHKPLHPEWDATEMVRHVQRVAAFTERFSYLLVDTPPDVKVEGTRFSVDAMSKLLVGHYRNHTAKAVKKFEAADWPKE